MFFTKRTFGLSWLTILFCSALSAEVSERGQQFFIPHKVTIEYINHPVIGVRYIAIVKQNFDKLILKDELKTTAENLGFDLRFLPETSAGLILKPKILSNHTLQVMSSEMRARQLKSLYIAMAQHPAIESLEEDTLQFVQTAAFNLEEEPLLKYQWNLLPVQKQQGSANVTPVWSKKMGKHPVTVAVIDTGVISKHPDLVGKILPGYDFLEQDDNAEDTGDYKNPLVCGSLPKKFIPSSWHGTHVAAIIAAKQNGKGMMGIVPGDLLKILPVRVAGSCGAHLSSVADAIRYAAGIKHPSLPVNQNPANIINLSLGSIGHCPKAYQSAINDAVDKGVAVVVSAGNHRSSTEHFMPANCQNVITVGASFKAEILESQVLGKTVYTSSDRFGRAEYSNFGKEVSLMAPGGLRGICYKILPNNHCADYQVLKQEHGILSASHKSVKTLEPGGQAYRFKQGSSFAAAHVTGVAATLLSINPELSPGEIKRILEQSARRFPKVNLTRYPFESCTRARCGQGLLDANAAIEATLELN